MFVDPCVFSHFFLFSAVLGCGEYQEQNMTTTKREKLQKSLVSQEKIQNKYVTNKFEYGFSLIFRLVNFGLNL